MKFMRRRADAVAASRSAKEAAAADAAARWRADEGGATGTAAGGCVLVREPDPGARVGGSGRRSFGPDVTATVADADADAADDDRGPADGPDTEDAALAAALGGDREGRRRRGGAVKGGGVKKKRTK
jgi:hypothetical protein